MTITVYRIYDLFEETCVDVPSTNEDNFIVVDMPDTVPFHGRASSLWAWAKKNHFRVQQLEVQITNVFDLDFVVVRECDLHGNVMT